MKGPVSKLIATVIIIFLLTVAGVVGYLVYDKFFRQNSAESFVKDDVIFMTKFNLQMDKSQQDKINKLEEKFGDEDIFKGMIAKLVFQGFTSEQIEQVMQEENLGWLGRDLAIARLKNFSNEEDSLFILEIADQQGATEFIDKVKNNLDNLGYVVETEQFRDREIVNLLGERNLSYTIFDNYLIVASSTDGVKQAIDVGLNRYSQLAKNSDYKKINKETGSKGVIMFYGNVAKFLQVVSQSFDPSSVLWSDQFAKAFADTNFGGKLLVEEDGFRLASYIESLAPEKKPIKNFATKLDNLAPADALVYYEGEDARNFIKRMVVGKNETDQSGLDEQFSAMSRLAELQTGVSLDEVVEIASARYCVFANESEATDMFDISLVFELTDGEKAKENLSKLEGVITNYLSDSIQELGATPEFKTLSIDNNVYKHLDLPDDLFYVDLLYTVVGDKLVITTSESALRGIFSRLAGNGENLANDSVYQNSTTKLNEKSINQFYYVRVEAPLLNFAQGLLAENAEDEELQSEIEKLKAIRSIILGNQRIKEGNYLDGFIFIYK